MINDKERNGDSIMSATVSPDCRDGKHRAIGPA